MNTSTLKYFIVSAPKTKFSDEQVLLSEFTGKQFDRNQAEVLFNKIMAHKWNMSEKLNRDVGLRVAAVDFIENFYQPNEFANGKSFLLRSMENPMLRKFIRFYFESKSKLILA